MSDLKPVMSMFVSELDCLRARDKWHGERIAELEAENGTLSIELAQRGIDVEELEVANARMKACLEAIVEHHNILATDNGLVSKTYNMKRRDFAREGLKP